jgi:biotin carboxylase
MTKSILIVGAGIEQVLAIRQAKDLGLRVIACDGNPSAPGLQEGDIGRAADIKDEKLLAALAEEFNVDGIFCHAVEIPHIIARVAKKMNLPGLDPEIALRATNKVMRINRLTKCNIPCARFETSKNETKLNEKAERIGFPLVVKPVDSAGSRGVRIVESGDDLQDAYQTAMNYSGAKEVLLEELLAGPQVSTESLIYKGKVYTFAFADRNYSQSYYPYFVENGINFPSVLPQNLQESICNLVEKTIICLGIDFGAAKGDIIVDKGQPKIIEMAARTSGGWFGAGSIPIATGINMLKPLIQMAVRDEPDLLSLSPTRMLGCAQRYIIPTEDGIYAGITGIEEALQIPGVSMSTFFPPHAGARIRKATNHAERYGQLICTGRTREEAIERCETAVAKIKIHLEKEEEKNE